MSDKDLGGGEDDLDRPCRGADTGRTEAKAIEEVVRGD